VLVTTGLGLVLTTLVSRFVTSSATGVNLGVLGQAGGYVVAAALDVGLFVAAFRMPTDREISSRECSRVRSRSPVRER